jgi:hypothetical protein
MPEPRELAERTEAAPRLPEGTEERFSGYGVMGLPFRSGHVLGLRRFAASSLGRGYAVWRRTVVRPGSSTQTEAGTPSAFALEIPASLLAGCRGLEFGRLRPG